jgi:HEAT repeat protein
MTVSTHLQEIGQAGHHLAMRELKPLSSLGSDEHDAFWQAWSAIAPRRRVEVARAMVDLAEDNVELDFDSPLIWMLDDDDAQVRMAAIEGLWENQRSTLLQRLLKLLRVDPSADVRAAAAVSLSRFAYMASLDELDEGDVRAIPEVLLTSVRDARQPLEVRRRSLESAGYFATNLDIQREIGAAYESDEQLLRESALTAMGRSMLPSWLPTIARELDSSSPALRYEAARAVGEMAEDARSLTPKLAQLVNDGDSEVAFAAIWALGQVGGEAAKRMLQQVRKLGDDARRQAADEALEELSLNDGFFA